MYVLALQIRFYFSCRLYFSEIGRLIMPEEKKSIYQLKLHEELSLSKWLCVFRVPGGWIYQTSRYEWDNTAVFVPFSNQFYQEEMNRVRPDQIAEAEKEG